MIGLGTIVNCITVIAGTTVGIFLKSGLPERFERIIMQGLGLCTCFIGIGGAVSGLLTVQDGTISTQHTMLLVLSMVLGALLGEACNIEKRLDSFGSWCQTRFTKGNDSKFVEGFVASSLLFCVGAMSIVGALENGLTGNFDTLKAKSVLDGISSIIFASSLGVGVALSAVPVLLYQGLISLAAGVLSPLLGDVVIAEMTCVGSLLIVAMGLNMLGVTKIKVMNLVPGIFLPILLCRIL